MGNQVIYREIQRVLDREAWVMKCHTRTWPRQGQNGLSSDTSSPVLSLPPASMPRFLHHNAGVGGHLAGRPRRCLVEVLPWEWPDTLGQGDLIRVRI